LEGGLKNRILKKKSGLNLRLGFQKKGEKRRFLFKAILGGLKGYDKYKRLGDWG